MLGQLFNGISKHMRNAVLLLIAVVFTSTSAVAAFSTNVSAAEIVDSSITAATTYEWTDRQTISVTGGSVISGQGIKVDANAENPTTGGGSILMTEKLTIKDCWLFICSESTPSADCFVSMSITIASGLKQGTLKAVIVPSAGNSGGPVACTQKSYDAYNGKVISIGGTRPGSTDTTVETDIQKTVFFVVKSNFSNSDAPESVKIKITGVSSKTLTATKSELYGNVTFRVTTTLEPGAYNASVENPPEGLVVDTVGFMKSKFTQLTVNMGGAEGFADRQIETLIKITTQDPSSQTYGPLELNLYADDGVVVNTGVTNSVSVEAVTEDQLDERTVNLSGVLDGVDPGTYKLCVGPGESLCQDVVKEDGKRKQVSFETTGDALLATQPTTTSCAIDGIGWMVCPLMTALAAFNDFLYDWIEDVLVLNPLQMNDPATGEATAQYQNWQAMRDIANVLLVIVFLIVIFSQATSVGINNYGIKKMLPRIVLIAIAINVSYFIMMLSIDAVNLIGVGTNSLLSSTAVSATPDNLNNVNVVGSLITGGAVTIGVGTIGVLAAGGLGAAALIALPFIAVAALSLLAAVATMFLRNALVIVLVVIAPIALVAYLLPNTEGLFDKWRKLFISMLMLFPMAALLFAGAKFAAYIILTSDQELSIIAALFIMAAPLGALPWLMSQSNSILAGVNNRLQGMAKSAKSPLQKFLKPRVDRSASRYRSGENNVFGVQRSASARARSRTAGQAIAQARKSTEGEAHAAAEDGDRDYEERALAGTGRSGRRAMHVIDHGSTNALRKTANDKQIQERVDRRMGTAGSAEQGYADRAGDAQRSSDRFQAVEKDRQANRVLNGARSSIIQTAGSAGAASPERLNSIARQQFAADQALKDTELKIDRSNKESGVANASIASQNRTQEFIDKFDKDRTLDHKEVMNTDPEMVELSKQASFTDKKIAKQEGDTKLRNNQRARMSSTMRQVEADTKDAAYSDSVLENRKSVEAEERLTTDPLMAQIRRGKEADDTKKERLLSQQGRDLQERKGAGGSLFEEDALKRANEVEQAASKKEADQLFTEATTDAVAAPGSDLEALENVDPALRTRLQRADERSDISTSATARAESVANQEFADRVLNDNSVARKAAGIDPAGVPIAQARAAESQRKSIDESIAAFSVLHKREGLPGSLAADANNEPAGADSLIGKFKDETITLEEREAAIRAIVNSGNIDDIEPAFDFITSELDVADAQHKAAVRSGDMVAAQAATQRIERLTPLQKAIGETIGSSAGKSIGIGAGEIANLKTGKYLSPNPPTTTDPVSGAVVQLLTPAAQASFARLGASEKQLVATITAKGITDKSVPGTDKRNLASILKLAKGDMLPPETAAKLWSSFDSALSDPDIYTDIKSRETGFILRAMAELEASTVRSGGSVPARRARLDRAGVATRAIELRDLPPEHQ